jgi:hypothetical protein
MVSRFFKLSILTLLSFGQTFAQTEQFNYKNGIGIYPPLPGILVVEYERFLTDYSEKNTWSTGISFGYGYDAGKLKLSFAKGIDDLFETPVSFKSKWDIAVNPFVRYYFGNPENKFRPSAMFKPSLVIINIENEKNYTFPAYEFHFMGTYSFSKRFYASISLGFKHFLTYEKIEYNGEETYFPAFRFDAENPDEKPKRWLPATDIAIGYRF